MTIISVVIRQFFLPNPFECFGDNAAVINWIAAGIIHVVAWGIVNLNYVKGSAPTIGSLLYLITYAIITGILCVMGIFSFAWWWVMIVSISVIVIIAIVSIISFLRREDYN